MTTVYNLIKLGNYFKKFIKVPGLIKIVMSWEDKLKPD
jgi:hypothetical protein